MADRALINKATDSTSSPTPGYLYKEITSTLQNDSLGLATAQYLLGSRLPRSSPFTKTKTLKLITTLARSGVCRGFTRECVKGVSSIRLCQSFTGPPDPVRGDSQYVMVRQAATECLEACYSDEGTFNVTGRGPVSASQGSGGQRVMEGIGGGGDGLDPRLQQQQQQQVYNSVQPGAPISTGRMQGIGSDPSYRPEGAGGGGRDLSSKMDNFVSTAKMGLQSIIKDPLGSNITRANNSQPPGRMAVSRATGGEYNLRSNVPSSSTFSSERPNATSGAQATSGVGGGWGGRPALSAGGMSGGGSAATNGSYEKSLILALTPSSGLGLSCPAAELAEFLTVVHSLNCDCVAIEMLERLSDTNASVKGRCFNLMKAVIDSEGGRGNYTDFFITCAEEIKTVAQSEGKQSVRAVGLKLYEQLTGTTATASAPASAPVAVAVAAPIPDLLDFGAPSSEPVLAAPSPPPVSAPTAPPPSAPAPAPPATPAGDLFGGMQTRSSAPSPVPAPSADLFGGLNTNAPAAAPPAAAAPPPPPPIDVFAQDDASVERRPSYDTGMSPFATRKSEDLPEPPLQGTDLFAGLSAQPSPTAAAGSGFSFMGGGEEAPPPAPVLDILPSPERKPAFDPLSLDPLSKANSAPVAAGGGGGVNPQQQQMQMMQMAYQQQQQQMIMMQQQMAVMQMQGGGGQRGGLQGMMFPGMNMGAAMPAQAQGQQAGFGFMGGGGGGGGGGGSGATTSTGSSDAFSFVQDTMKKA